MKRCPTCNRTYTDDALSFCLDDGAPLLSVGNPSSSDPNATVLYPGARETNPQPTQAYQPQAATGSQAAPQPNWVPMPPSPPAQPARRRNPLPWIIGGVVLGVVMVIGAIVVLAIIGASLDSNKNTSDGSTKNTNYGATKSDARTSPSPAEKSSTPSNTSASTSSVRVTEIYMAEDDGSGQPGDAVSSFEPSERTIHCVITLSDSQAGTRVRFAWHVVDAGEMKDQLIKNIDYTTNALENKVHANLSLPRDWPTGEYKVEVYLNDKLDRTIEYTVE
ncbi:MAG TPA: hypothetical protein VD966_06220 [Pyrinomonadaceae bacterium]|nr:hypothetical protein [Pyrinomonadaceae bacterium]